MDFLANVKKQEEKNDMEIKKEFMPTTKLEWLFGFIWRRSSYYRLTEGLKSFWNSTGATPEIRQNNISYSFQRSSSITARCFCWSIWLCLLEAFSSSATMET